MLLQLESRHEKIDFCLCTDYQLLCFRRYLDSTIPRLPKSEVIFRGRTGRFVSDLVGNPENRFSNVEAHLNDVRASFTCI